MPRAVSPQGKPLGRSRTRHRSGSARPSTRHTTDASTDLTRAFELAALIESASDAVVGVSPAGAITGWGAGATRLFGYSRAQALGQPVAMLAPADRVREPG